MAHSSRYVKAPQPSEEVRPLYEAVMAVLTGQLTVTQAAQTVDLSRLRFQTRLHRGLTGLLEALADQPRGRRPTPEAEQAMKEELVQLRRQNQQLQKQVESTARMMGLASEWMHKGLRSAQRETQTGPARSEATESGESEEDPAVKRLSAALKMQSDGILASLAAAAVGVSAPTVRRWKARQRQHQPLRNPRGPAAATTPAEGEQNARAMLEEVRGCMGAVALSKATGLSRRQAARARAEVLTEREQDRREDAIRVVTQPGVIRGFDALFAGQTPVLAAADGALPFRTTLKVVAAYNEEAVRAAISEDLETHGAPLVWRMDRAKAHTAPSVLKLLDEHEVLVIQGPPRCPQFYGQLERQNREHRAWLKWLGPEGWMNLEAECDRMRHSFNEVVPRRRLGWQTAGSAWRNRERLVIDRKELKQEVEQQRRKLEEAVVPERRYAGLIERLAIEQVLTKRGLLRLTKGGWC